MTDLAQKFGWSNEIGLYKSFEDGDKTTDCDIL
jgi:hypothetical protein